ncbi:hypothetical protein [Phyllobacterium sophorae]|uniref:Uncharacterized protein n=1 Tax=Phyllobacterium sophorae TaxID=1520277 RepID=A0A2P7BFU0_9HYPH|nr:hypothetical protein [Phyllobacterium sophorae]PSH65305.1 hypothetical protein CU103_09900 [Phyllobacterium sophorae]
MKPIYHVCQYVFQGQTRYFLANGDEIFEDVYLDLAEIDKFVRTHRSLKKAVRAPKPRRFLVLVQAKLPPDYSIWAEVDEKGNVVGYLLIGPSGRVIGIFGSKDLNAAINEAWNDRNYVQSLSKPAGGGEP